VAAILEIARMLQESQTKPKRTLIFVAFGAEENGLLGAYHYAAHPVVPLSATRAVLNLDMIARDEAHTPSTQGQVEIAADTSGLMNLSGGAWSPELAAAVSSAAEGVGLRIDSKYDADATQGVLWRSDHFPFLLRGVPAVWIFAGFHPGYHESTETVEKLNFTKLEKVIRLTHHVALELADGAKPPAFRAR
jgi:Zn-dependent M28 family amino/carboxypeptidase